MHKRIDRSTICKNTSANLISLLQHPRSQDSSVGPLLCDDVPGPSSLHCEAGRTDIASNSVSPESSGEGLSRWGKGKGGGQMREVCVVR